MPKGTFTTTEAYKIISANTSPLDPIWGRIWSAGTWPKVSLFLWLVGHRKILKWDKLRRRNYHGPSICVNCKSQEETLQHLMDSCTLANQMWEKASFQCQRTCRVSNDITNSIRQWHQNPYKSEVLNQLWRLIPGLLTWCIWKERNKCIFKDQTTPLEIIWGNFCLNLKETLELRTWMLDDFPTLANEKAIWANWNLPLPQGNPSQAPSENSKEKKDTWIPPPKHIFKLNFNGASKGNPGNAGYGGIFRNHEGSPLLIYCGNKDFSFLESTTFTPWKLKVTPSSSSTWPRKSSMGLMLGKLPKVGDLKLDWRP